MEEGEGGGGKWLMTVVAIVFAPQTCLTSTTIWREGLLVDEHHRRRRHKVR